MDFPLTLGIEEEYLLVHPQSGDLLQTAPKSLMPALKKALGEQVAHEFLQCQVEVGTKVCRSFDEARAELEYLRQTVADIAADHDLAIIAASTHPFGQAQGQVVTSHERYATLAEDLQAVVRRLLISGMHVHIGAAHDSWTDDLRIDLMSQLAYILPHLLALSTSSPFWQGADSGLKSYRISVWGEMPRTGLPEHFDSYSEYQRHVAALVNAGVIEDATKIWWDLRPSDRYPTLEMRIADLCTTLDDTLSIAALYACWTRMLLRLKQRNQRWREYANMLIDENRWRAHRYGIDEGLIDFGRGEIVAYSQLLDEILQLVSEDAAALDCEAEIAHARAIIDRGTSAHRQLAVYAAALENGEGEKKALKRVVDWLREETLAF